MEYCSHCMSRLESNGTCSSCNKRVGEIPPHHLLPGTVLNGKFCVGEALGEGGFGITYIGRDLKLDMKVAIKEFYPNGYANRSNTMSPEVNTCITEDRREFFENGRERFLKEAQILAKFSGEAGIVDVRDFFEENNTAYIIMEYLDGVDLKTYLRDNGPLTAEHTLRLLMPVMESLKKVHSNGLIHRDISPDNIMILGDKVKLLDFGAARTVSAEANKSLSIMLKPGYAPEEQYRSKGEQGAWTDVYALCATMYKCITGITPDDANQRMRSDEVKTPSALGIEISPEVERAIMRGMSVNYTDRYQNIDDLLRGLQGIDVERIVPEITINNSEKERANMTDDREAMFLENESYDGKTYFMGVKSDEVTFKVNRADEVSKNEVKVQEKVEPEVKKVEFEKRKTEYVPVFDDKKTIVDSVKSESLASDERRERSLSTGTMVTLIAIAVAIIIMVVFIVLPNNKDSDNESAKIPNIITQLSENQD